MGNEKNLVESALIGKSSKKLNIVLKNGFIDRNKIANGAVSLEKLSDDVINILSSVSQGHSNAYINDYLFVEDFALDPSIKDLEAEDRHIESIKALNKWLDAIEFNINTDIKYIGRCKLKCNGVNIECYNYIYSWGNQTGIQQISGPVKISSSNTIEIVPDYSILYRIYNNGKWENWRSYSSESSESVSTKIVTIELKDLDSIKDKYDDIYSNNVPCIYQIVKKDSSNVTPIGIMQVWIDYTAQVLHQVIDLSCGLTDNKELNFDSVNPELIYSLHRCYNKREMTWGKWQEIGGDTLASKVNEMYERCANTPITNTEIDNMF